MMEPDLELEYVKLEKYLIKNGRSDFLEEIKSLSLSQMNERLLNLSKHRQQITTTKNNDDELIRAKDKVKMLQAPYSEQLKMNDKLSRYLALKLEEKDS